jgi:hypothetical protein
VVKAQPTALANYAFMQVNPPESDKLDSLRALEEAGISAPSYRILLRRLPAFVKDSWLAP